MNRILQLQQDKAALIDAAQTITKLAQTEKRRLTDAERATVKAKIDEAEGLQETIDLEQRISAASNIPTDRRTGGRAEVTHENFADRPPFGWEPRSNETKEERRTRNMCAFGEQLVCIADAARSPHRAPDARLLEINKRGTPSGASEQVPADGGFLVYPDFSSEILMIAHETGLVHAGIPDISAGCRKLPLSDATNSIKIPGVDEQSRTDGNRWGGVRMYWQNEADATTATKPKFRLIELVTKKLMGLFYSTDELIADARMLGAIVTQAFGEEVGFKLDDAVINGDGSGKPLGVLNSNALITVAKETGQATNTILTQNIVKMYYRLHARSRRNAVWFVNQDTEQQLLTLTLPVGTGGSSVVEGMGPVGGKLYTPPGVDGYGRMYGRPVIPIEQANTLSSAGDVMLVDPTQYVYVDKGDPQQATSMHVAFLTDQMTFRWVYRVDGQPWWHTPLTPYKGSNSQSPFITLAAR